MGGATYAAVLGRRRVRRPPPHRHCRRRPGRRDLHLWRLSDSRVAGRRRLRAAARDPDRSDVPSAGVSATTDPAKNAAGCAGRLGRWGHRSHQPDGRGEGVRRRRRSRAQGNTGDACDQPGGARRRGRRGGSAVAAAERRGALPLRRPLGLSRSPRSCGILPRDGTTPEAGPPQRGSPHPPPAG